MRKPKIVLSTLSHKKPDGSRDTIDRKIIATFNEYGTAQLTCSLLREHVYADLLVTGRIPGGKPWETDPNSRLYILAVER